MNPKPYIILGEIVDEKQTYWQENYGWTISEKHATHYTADILVHPLPIGSSSVMNDTSIALLIPHETVTVGCNFLKLSFDKF